MKIWIEHSQWIREDEKEPTVGAPGVPICTLQLTEKGQSICCRFLVSEKDRKGKILGYKCASDPSSTRDRLTGRSEGYALSMVTALSNVREITTQTGEAFNS
jgi:hypothetical protein